MIIFSTNGIGTIEYPLKRRRERRGRRRGRKRDYK